MIQAAESMELCHHKFKQLILIGISFPTRNQKVYNQT